MSDALFLSLNAGATGAASGPSGWVVRWATRGERGGVVFRALPPRTLSALRRLDGEGAAEDELIAGVGDGDGARHRLLRCLDRLDRRGLLLRSARAGGVLLATLTPPPGGWAFAARPVAPGRRYLLSRFAAVRRDGCSLAVDSPRAGARVVLHDARAAALIGTLAEPGTVAELTGRVGSLPAGAVADVLALLLNGDALDHPPDGGAPPSEDETPALRTGEFHDLLFHAGWRRAPGGPRGAGPVPAAGPASAPAAFFDLPRPDVDHIRRHDPPLGRVQAARRSTREYGADPLTVRQLGEFLDRTARAGEPFPGAPQPLEIFPVVDDCAGLDAGLYRYDRRRHRLARLCGRTADVERLLADAAASAGLAESGVQALLVLAAGRTAPAPYPYALLLQQVGALFQTMYLVATAMGLAPCALGCGDSDAFARAAGADYYAEPSVGEFLLGSMR